MNIKALKNQKIYLASPYSHPLNEIKLLRFQETAMFAGELHKMGLIFFSPICHSHPIADFCAIDGAFETWQQLDRAFLDWSDVIVVLGLVDWERSNGIRHEIIYAYPRKVYLWKPQYHPEHLDSLTIEGNNYIIHEG